MNSRKILATTLLGTLVTAAAQAEDYYVILTGLGGEAYYDETFEGRARYLSESLTHLNVSADQQHLLDSTQTTLEAIESVFGELGTRMGAGDRLQLYLVGHGSYDGDDYKFNIDGPDLTGRRLGELLDQLPEGPQLVVAMTSASGALQELLADERRVLISATKSGAERNAPVFGDYWVAGLSDAAADTNKNELLSAAELYRYSLDQVAMHYETDNLLAPEHALASDEDGADDFVVARVGMLASRPLNQVSENLLAERSDLEIRIQTLIESRGRIPESAYFDQLQSLMLELGRLQQRLDAELEPGNAP